MIRCQKFCRKPKHPTASTPHIFVSHYLTCIFNNNVFRKYLKRIHMIITSKFFAYPLNSWQFSVESSHGSYCDRILFCWPHRFPMLDKPLRDTSPTLKKMRINIFFFKNVKKMQYWVAFFVSCAINNNSTRFFFFRFREENKKHLHIVLE